MENTQTRVFTFEVAVADFWFSDEEIRQLRRELSCQLAVVAADACSKQGMTLSRVAIVKNRQHSKPS